MQRWMLGAGVVAALVIALGAGWARAGGKFDKDSCSFNGKRLYGKVQIVSAFPDVKVQIVNAFPDLKVQKVTAFPDACGKWQLVNAFPDVKVQLVTAFPDVKVQYVDAFPGTR